MCVLKCIHFHCSIVIYCIIIPYLFIHLDKDFPFITGKWWSSRIPSWPSRIIKDHTLTVVKGLLWLSKVTRSAVQGHPRWMGHRREFWKNMIHWRRKWQPTLVYLPREPHEQYENGKINNTGSWAPPGRKVQYVVQYATGEEQRAITNSSRKN